MDAERSGEPRSTVAQTTWCRERSDVTTAVLCYFDGPIAKAPPPAPQGTAPTPFDRAVVAVMEDASVTAVALGYRENLPLHAPPRS
jgi:hypothetical protein